MSEGQGPHWPRQLTLDDEAGPAPYITRAKVDALVRGALDQANYAVPGALGPGGAGKSAMPHKPGLGTRSLVAAVLLACLTVGSASAAVMWFAKKPAAPTQATPPRAPGAAPRAPRRAPVHVPPQAAAPYLEAPAEQAQRDKHTAHAPEDWLVEGNRLRAERRWAKADDAYTRAAQHAPNTQTAYVARVASAAVRLEHLDDARGALSCYRAAQQQLPRGALAEEIQWGIAESARALGDRSRERAALELFLREFPSSPLADQAKARLD